MAERTSLSWGAVLDQVDAALEQALRETEARSQRLEALADAPAQPEWRALQDRLRLHQFPASHAEEADAALAEAGEAVRQWLARAAANRRKLADEAGREV